MPSSSLPLSTLLQRRLCSSHLHQIHAQILLTGQSQHNLIATRLIGHCPPQIALRVFNNLHNPNIFPFNALIRVLSETHLCSQAFSLFKSLKLSSISPNDLTFSFVLKACFGIKDVRSVQQVHTHVVKSGFDRDSSVCNGLVAVYAKGVGDMGSAHRVFDEMPERENGFCWTCLIAGYAQLGRCDEGLNMFLMMMRENVAPEDDTMVSVLSACSAIVNIGEIERWVSLFIEFKGHGYGGNGSNDERIDTVLVYLFAKLGEIEKSRELFDRIAADGGRGLLHWNSMIGGYLQNGLPIEALNLFHLMMSSKASKPNHVTMVSVLSACAQVGNLELGRWVHRYMRSDGRERSLSSNPFLASALIDMYSKCGSLDMAKEVFDQMMFKDVVSFNAMIMGLAVNGEGERALMVFSKMEEFGVLPNGGTFLAVLSACNHSGLVSEGRKIFLSMHKRHSFDPELEHYACYIDLLARVGHIEEALKVFNSMPIEPNGQIWGALLGGCLAHHKVDIARDIARKLVEVDPNNSAGYVILSNAYAADYRWWEISELREMMREKGVNKHPGCSWISVEGVVHEFLVGCSSHPQIKEIYSSLNGLFKKMKSPDLFAFS